MISDGKGGVVLALGPGCVDAPAHRRLLALRGADVDGAPAAAPAGAAAAARRAHRLELLDEVEPEGEEEEAECDAAAAASLLLPRFPHLVHSGLDSAFGRSPGLDSAFGWSVF